MSNYVPTDDRQFDIEVEIKSKFDEKIAEAFSFYDFEQNNSVTGEDLGLLLWSLGCVMTEEELQNFIKATEFKERPGYIHLYHFLNHIKFLIQNKKLKPYTGEELYDVFKFFDSKETGYIEMDDFVNLMKKGKEPLNEEELQEMLKVCLDPETKRIYYMNYINKIAYVPRDVSIFDLFASA